MKKQEAFQAILGEWMKLPESKRNSEDKAGSFALGIMQDRPELTDFKAPGDNYLHIKAFLCRQLGRTKQKVKE